MGRGGLNCGEFQIGKGLTGSCEDFDFHVERDEKPLESFEHKNHVI